MIVTILTYLACVHMFNISALVSVQYVTDIMHGHTHTLHTHSHTHTYAPHTLTHSHFTQVLGVMILFKMLELLRLGTYQPSP